MTSLHAHPAMLNRPPHDPAGHPKGAAEDVGAQVLDMPIGRLLRHAMTLTEEQVEHVLKYQREHNVFTLVRSCRELFDSTRKKSLMLFMRPVIPVRDRFHYDEYYKLFFPEEFAADVRSIFGELIPRELIERSMRKALDKKRSAI